MSQLDKIYTFSVTDAGAPATGLTPTFSLFKFADDSAIAGSTPTISEIGSGIYAFTVDWSAESLRHDIVYSIDAGASIGDNTERYIFGICSPDRMYLDVLFHAAHGKAILSTADGELQITRYDPTGTDREGSYLCKFPVFEDTSDTAFDADSTKILERKPLDLSA